MAPRSFRIRLIDIREEIAGIRSLTANATAESFSTSWAMKRAIEHALLIVAEAAKHIPADLKETRPEVPWKKIHGLGNMLRHEYRRIDPDILWSVVTENLDDLDEAIEAMLSHEE
ncbi:HepT-like ribonuclease domain-containing protein [Bradyrhizobium sp.]|uniref:HepT-like ribonuclease domain-containing protein n=1 Tax=Bradyrhizobium sp. TaxID=376 RepID=UPI00239960A9|nr:HepT-like ribonuclease domain-containing protein [Bradyrhizobium sp.]MDE2378489.1 DUF86 domain-containing protein [Bradyrhizobium sp.]